MGSHQRYETLALTYSTRARQNQVLKHFCNRHHHHLRRRCCCPLSEGPTNNPRRIWAEAAAAIPPLGLPTDDLLSASLLRSECHTANPRRRRRRRNPFQDDSARKDLCRRCKITDCEPLAVRSACTIHENIES